MGRIICLIFLIFVLQNLKNKFMKKYVAEMIGTMVLVLMGCGSAVIAGAEIGFLGIAFAFGLSVVAMAYAIGGISGCHINPAITLGVFLTGRMSGKDAGMYMLFHVIGALFGSGDSLRDFFRDGVGRNGGKYVWRRKYGSGFCGGVGVYLYLYPCCSRVHEC